MLIEIKKSDEIDNLINENIITVIYFTGTSCGACEVIKKKIKEILKEYSNVNYYEVDGEKNVDIAAKYGVFSLPILLLFIEGKETIRIGRNIDFLEFERSVERYNSLLFGKE
ncbi:thioredoxin [Clostridium bornimense]|uniref:Thioredoxin n=1 Tax=Clostridium bornimense TaxID=1216932 RepID=W6RT38_9CLOT|nr:thioredoxin [Clostridium bornimense]